MPWTEILNHENLTERFKNSVQRNRLASTYLFVGKPGIGKRKFALHLAKVLLCENSPPGFEACESCPACQQVQAGSHPDLIVVSKPPEKAFIPVETFIGDKEHRRREGLCHDIGLKPFRGGRKIAIVDDADFLNQEGANSLLKTLEEPPPNSVLILIGSSEHRQLPTIVSRSQVIRFDPLNVDQVRQILQSLDMETSIPLVELASASAGSVRRALELADEDTFQFRKDLIRQLATGDPAKNEFAKSVAGFVDGAGKDGAKKRKRLRLVADLAIEFYREWYLAATDADGAAADSELRKLAAKPAQQWQAKDPDLAPQIAAAAIDRCMELQRQVAANVNQGNAIEGWLIDLGNISRGSVPTMVF